MLFYLNILHIIHVHTRESSNIHLLQVFCFQDDNRQFSSSWNVTQWETDVTESIFLHSSTTEQLHSLLIS